MTHRNPELSWPPRSQFLRPQAVALKIKASSGLTSSCNSKVVKDTTGEDLISTSLQLGSECSIRSCGWTSGAPLEPQILLKDRVPEALCWTLQWFPTGHFCQGTEGSSSHAVVEKEHLCLLERLPCAWRWLFACAASTPHTSSRLTSAHSTGHDYDCACTLSQSWALGDNSFWMMC